MVDFHFAADIDSVVYDVQFTSGALQTPTPVVDDYHPPITDRPIYAMSATHPYHHTTIKYEPTFPIRHCRYFVYDEATHQYIYPCDTVLNAPTHARYTKIHDSWLFGSSLFLLCDTGVIRRVWFDRTFVLANLPAAQKFFRRGSAYSNWDVSEDRSVNPAEEFVNPVRWFPIPGDAPRATFGIEHRHKSLDSYVGFNCLLPMDRFDPAPIAFSRLDATVFGLNYYHFEMSTLTLTVDFIVYSRRLHAFYYLQLERLGYNTRLVALQKIVDCPSNYRVLEL